MKSQYFEVTDHPESSRQNLFENGDSSYKRGRSSKRIGIGIAVVCFLALLVGLTVGLSIDKNNEETTVAPANKEPDGCLDYSKLNNRKARSSRTKRWLTEGNTPVPGKATCPEGFEEPPLLVVSMDGFRAEYLTRGFTPTMKRLSESGVHAPYMRATFPTKTFPNHYTIMTGLYTESHGIIDNTMYDLEWGEQFLRGSTSLDGKWWGGEPMWLTSKRQGKKSATMFWPGSESNITGEYPDYCYNYDQSVDFDSRIDQVFTWLDLDPELRPSFITLYFHEPDSRGHNYGPFSDEVNTQLAEMDRLVGNLMDGIAERELEQCINIIILADHGMGELYCGYTDRRVYMEDYLNVSQYYIYEGVHSRITSKYVKNPEGGVTEVPNPEPTEVTLAKLQCNAYNDTKDWYARFYHKSHLPKRFHYANHRRIDDIVIEIEDKWQVVEDRETYCEAGSHGYDNTYKSMHALFMAFGPAFKQNFAIEPFENIEVYNLMAEVLGVTPADNNGTQGRLHHILIDPAPLKVPPPSASEYLGCPFPDDETAAKRRNMTDCVCDDLEDITDKSIVELDQQLNLNEAEVNLSIETHLPYGVPQIDLEEVSVCQLTQRDHVTGYSYTHRMPLWTAYKLNKWAGHSILDPGNSRSDKLVAGCVRADVRLENQTDCSEYVDKDGGITHTFLYPPGFSNSTDEQLDSHVTSNLVPMYEQFRQGIWQELLLLVEEYAEKYESIYVTSGPIFDNNSDGLADELSQIEMFVNNGTVPLPSHYYLSVSTCDTADCVQTTQLFGVVLLHIPVLENCWGKKEWSYIKENVVRFRDIELLTGIRFFTEVSNMTERVKLQTHLQVGLLPRISWMDLGEEAIPAEGVECPAGYNSDHPPVLLISIDGFRNDYITRNLTPTLTRLRDLGVKTDHMRSIYPTITFPNHYTQVTGLYPESHGIVDNSMCDTDLGFCFSLGSPTSSHPDWWGGQPIWNTLELQNKTAMTVFWPGSDVEIQGIRPTRYLEYDNYYPYHLRVDTVLDWLNGSAGMIPDLVTLYFSSVDSAGHETGPLSIEVEEVMEVLDGHIKDIMDGLYRQKLHKCVNVIVVSDHGMSSISCENVVTTADYLSEDTMDNTYMYSGASSRISNEYLGINYTGSTLIPTPQDKIVPNEAIVSNLSCVSSNMDVFVKEDLPRRLHYMNNPRIDEVVLKVNDTWQAERYTPFCGIKGQHGWDPNYDSMKAFFLAFGPSIKSQHEVQPFENIELYNLLATLTNVTASPNNGTEGSLYDMLRQAPTLPETDPGVDYNQCDFPVLDGEYQDRANLTTAGCSCDTQDVLEYDERLNMGEVQKQFLESIHLPHGVPSLHRGQACLLYHSDFVSAYSQDSRTTLYTAFRLTREQVSGDIVVPECLRPDVRLTQADQPICADYTDNDEQISPGFLFTPDLALNASSVYDSLLTTNTVPMYDSFRSGVWESLLTLIKTWTRQLGEVHAMMGPVFDHQADGLSDGNFTVFLNTTNIPVASHYYAVILHCPGENCDQLDYQVKSIIVPHKPQVTNCMNTLDYLADNLGRIRDIELLTGLQILTGNHTQEAITTRTYMPEDLIWT